MGRARNWLGGALALTAAAVAAGTLPAQAQRVDREAEWCERVRGGWEDDQYCEVRESTLPAGEAVEVDAGRNGGISVEGWDADEIRVEARVRTRARSSERAQEIARTIRIVSERDRPIRAQGPGRLDDDESWSVSFRLQVPRDSDLRLEAYNGGISIREVRGRSRFATHNGGVRLRDVAGDVRGETRNGGLSVALSGSSWTGRGLDVETRNGGVTLEIPEGYSADLETGTVNGGMTLDFPVTVQGRFGRGHFRTTLGDGGAPVRVVTTNGGVRVRRR